MSQQRPRFIYHEKVVHVLDGYIAYGILQQIVA